MTPLPAGALCNPYMVRWRAFLLVYGDICRYMAAIHPVHRYNREKGRWKIAGSKKKRPSLDPAMSIVREMFQRNIQVATEMPVTLKATVSSNCFPGRKTPAN